MSMYIDTKAKDLCAVAREAADKAEALRNGKNRAAQKRLVKKIVGADLFDQCVYDAETNEWIICGRRLRCFVLTAGEPSPVAQSGLAYYYCRSLCFIRNLAELGAYLKQCDAEDERRIKENQRQSTVPIPPTPTPRPSWLSRLKALLSPSS
jgi:hypothetical protein